MINKKSIDSVNNSHFDEFTIPLKDSYCFSNIMGTAEKLLTGESKKSLPKDVVGEYKEKEKVVFFLIDAFGWKFYKKYKERSEFLKTIEEKGIVSKLTAQFPSATTSEITTALTNVTVDNHGIGDWYYYEPKVDSNIIAFLFNHTFKAGTENLKEEGFKGSDFLPKESFFKSLSEKKVKSIAYQPAFINKSTYSTYMFRDASLKDYDTYADLKKNLIQDLKKEGTEYYYVYLPEIDAMGHKYGESSKEFEKQVFKFIEFIDSFYKEVKDFENIGIMLSADHGQVEREEVIYLNKEYSEIYNYLKKDKEGKVYSPCGEARDMALHVEEENLVFLQNKLKEILGDKAIVLTIDQCIEKGIFNNLSSIAKERLGNLYIIPKGRRVIWFYEKDLLEVKSIGYHGGLSKDEMEIPFLYIEN